MFESVSFSTIVVSVFLIWTFTAFVIISLAALKNSNHKNGVILSRDPPCHDYHEWARIEEVLSEQGIRFLTLEIYAVKEALAPDNPLVDLLIRKLVCQKCGKIPGNPHQISISSLKGLVEPMPPPDPEVPPAGDL